MLRILDEGRRLCDGWTRREWMRIGSTALGGLSLPGLLQAAAEGGLAPRARAKRVIVFFLVGGPPQMESWDPKPEGPSATRGEFGAIDTRTPGLKVGELMPRTAEWTDRIAVLRAVVSHDNAHSTSGYQVMTGVQHLPLNKENATPGAPNFAPNMGAVVSALRGAQGGLPQAIALPRRLANVGEKVWPGQTAGYLGRRYDPWILKCDPSAEEADIPDLVLPDDVPAMRFDRRRALLEQINEHLAAVENSPAMERYDLNSQQALSMLGTARAGGAFDLSREDPRLRDRYGRHKWGQSVLLARRLVEAGVSLVQVNWSRIEGKENHGSWDTHKKHSACIKDFLMPMMDESFSTLLEDLDTRGMLDDTLVVWLGEFGRTPKFNKNGGRDHWGRVFSLALAGGGIRGGTVHGASDDRAAEPVEGKVEPKDVLATVYHCLGYPPETVVKDAVGRPVPISRGRVIEEIV